MSAGAAQKTVCRMCHGGCGVLVSVGDDQQVTLRGDAESPNSRGFICTKGLASGKLARHADRIRQPLRRCGPRGSGRFEPISWEQAYGEIAARLQQARIESGPESVVFAQGTDRNYQEWLFRFANAFGSPNVLGPAHVCFYPRVMAGILSMGAFTFCDYEGNPACLLAWGSNKLATHGDGVIGVRLLAALRAGTQLIVVDPRRTSLAQRARYWLQVTPGTDAALALAFLNVVITEELFDDSFVRAHTVGFEELRSHVADYPPESVSAICGVPASLIREAARFYAGARAAAIEAGTGIEQNRNSFQTARALLTLSALCGNIDRPGGDVIWEPSGLIGRRQLPASEQLPQEQQGKRLGGAEHRILDMAGWAHPGAVWRAILEQAPYRVRMLYVVGSNLLTNYADSERVAQALQEVETLVVHELFMTPTARMADLVLPVSSWLERDQIVEHAHYVAARPAVLGPLNSRSDEQILNDLAHALQLPGFFPSVAASLDWRLAPIGLTFSQLAERSYRANPLTYYKYCTHGFRTPHKKFCLYSRHLASLGYDPLPTYTPVPGSEPEAGEYILTSAHPTVFFNSEFRQITELRRKEPDPIVEMNPVDAEREHLANGEWVCLRIGDRRARFRVRTSREIAPSVLCAAAGWWFPESLDRESWTRSNLNLLTRNGGENPEMGSSNQRGIRCRISRLPATEEEPPLPPRVGPVDPLQEPLAAAAHGGAAGPGALLQESTDPRL